MSLWSGKPCGSNALATVRDAATTIDHEITKNILALEILSGPLGTGDVGVERLYREAKQLTDTIPGRAVALRRPTGETVFDTAFPLGTAFDKGTNEILALAESEAKTKRSFAIFDVFVGRRIPKAYVAENGNKERSSVFKPGYSTLPSEFRNAKSQPTINSTDE
jgi:hypothetical protein